MSNRAEVNKSGLFRAAYVKKIKYSPDILCLLHFIIQNTRAKLFFPFNPFHAGNTVARPFESTRKLVERLIPFTKERF